MPIIVIFLFILSIIFLILGYVSKRQWDEGAASINIAIGIVLLVADIILFFIMIREYHLYEKQMNDDLNYIIDLGRLYTSGKLHINFL
jgi:Na+/melibiose symporter-like transporter